MSLHASIHHTVPFHDIDIMHIVWHGHYLKYFELARTALMQTLGLDWPVLHNLGLALPVIKSEVNYRRPLLYGQRVLVEARIADPNLAALETLYTIRDEAEGHVMTTGMLRQAYVLIANQETLFEVPEPIRQVFMQHGA